MALNKNSLKTEIQTFADTEYSGFDKFPESELDAAQAFADALKIYATSIVPASTTVSAASSAMISALGTLSISEFQSALTTFASTVGGGMAPAYTATPPSTTIDFSTVTSKDGENAEDSINELVNVIDTWMKTGTATPSAGGSPIPWS